MQGITTPLFADYVMLWILVDTASFDPSDQSEDEIVWTQTSKGVYSANSAYLMQFDGSMESSFPARGLAGMDAFPLQVLPMVNAAKPNMDHP
jgi:hypothetical protein